MRLDAGLPAAAELGLKRRDARLERLILFAREPRHVLDRLELLALDQIEVAQPALRLVAEHGVELTPHARRDAGGVVHQARHFVEKTVAGLGHRRPWMASNAAQTMAIARRARKGCRRRIG